MRVGVFLPLLFCFGVSFPVVCCLSPSPNKIKPIELLGGKFQVVITEYSRLIWHFCFNLTDKSELTGYLHKVHTNSPQ